MFRTDLQAELSYTKRRCVMQRRYFVIREADSFGFHHYPKRVIMGTSDKFGYTKESEAGT